MSLSPASLARLVEADRLLVVTDFDGTLAGLSTDIYGVPVNADALAALTRLAGLPDTHVAVLSGRHLAGLRQVCHLQPPVVFAGSHGSESAEHGVTLTPAQEEALAHLDEALVFRHPLVHVERKPFQRVVHTAPIAATDQATADAILEKALLIDAPGARVSRGKNIVEFSVSDVTKGTWLAAEINRVSPDVAVFIGDDTTDEDGFRILRPGDVSVKVGAGETAAAERVADIPAVADLLTRLADARSAHLGIPRDVVGRFEAVAAGFTAEVLRVTDWDAATPCEGWAASDIVNHLLTWYPANLRNADIDLEVTGDTPTTRWFSFVAAVRELLHDERATATFHSGPDEGSTVTQATTAFLLPDIFMHTWDLARSQGHDVTLDPDYAARNLAGLQSLGGALQETGQFGPPLTPPADASPGEQLMAYVGREVR
ncbi:trehalose-6-phosphate phosphatase [Corynebacterium humireducens NBRC 106098 = DSM 45392]|uniref:Trehalose 6-phosphate phosphatase n=1 Tax=Corynebacterium humireducens NBRC 106098 = DSM 45392 TaxID=1223515 RepID=A0A0B5D4W4_9CORY|nr:trehalose-phosphatase [Corynebacterium humireducens]AJE34055.1 trehalose-6-phosphate phosphatase [Corynebacterium humireducens NBRC 106098 = DSM 45392]